MVKITNIVAKITGSDGVVSISISGVQIACVPVLDD